MFPLLGRRIKKGALTTFTSAAHIVTVILMEKSVEVDFTCRVFAVLPHDQKDPRTVTQLHLRLWNDYGVPPEEKLYLILQAHLALLAKYPLSGVSVSQESLIYLLDKEVTGRTGNLVAVSVGGAIEALESRPGHYVLMLSRRRGFFRIALRTGAYLIPSIGFGETSMYDQVANPTGSALRKLQDWFTHTFTLAPPLFYSTRVIPYRKPLTVVVGRPIICRRVPHPTDEEIDNLREQYKQQLREIFNRYRPLYDPTAEDIRFY